MIRRDGSVLVTAPKRISTRFIEKFIVGKAEWIEKKLEEFKKLPKKEIKDTKLEYIEHKEAARKLAHERIEYFNSIYKFSYKKISIRNQSTRWGSCSRKGNLNFNYKIALLPKDLADYIIVHELCHLKEHNHSPRFWKLVERTIPDYLKLRKTLKHYNFEDSKKGLS
jgi:predicted metal-dependent hydrolase